MYTDSEVAHYELYMCIHINIGYALYIIIIIVKWTITVSLKYNITTIGNSCYALLHAHMHHNQLCTYRVHASYSIACAYK